MSDAVEVETSVRVQVGQMAARLGIIAAVLIAGIVATAAVLITPISCG